MRAAVWTDPEKPMHIDDVPDPTPEPEELVLRVRGCGICGSDLHAAALPSMAPGSIMGHEFAGEIVEVGSRAEGDWKVGDRVCALPAIGCGSCEACVNGWVLHCRNGRSTGFGDVGGAYAEYVRVGARETFALPDSLDAADGALTEPLAVALHAIDEGRVKAGDDVLILGGGPVGLAIALWCRHFGAREVVVSEFVDERRALAERMGATGTVDPANEELGPAFQKLAGRAPDVVVEAVGVPGVLQQCIDVAPRRSRVIVAGVCMQPDTIVPLSAVLKELTLHGVSYYRRQDFGLTLDMLRRERIDPFGLVSHRIGLEELPSAFEALKKPTDQCKVIVQP